MAVPAGVPGGGTHAALPSASRTMTAALGATLLAMMPAFLVGGLSVFIQADLGIDEAGFGLATSSFFATSCVFSIFGGAAVQRLDVRQAVLFAPLIGLVALLGVGLVAHSLAALIACMVVGGIGNALAQPAANRALSYGIPPRRHGLAFGAKQAAVPLSSVLAGVAVPVIAAVGGWRWAIVGAAVFAYLCVAAVPHGYAPPQPRTGEGAERLRRTRLLLLSLSAGLATAGTTATGAFMVQSVANQGLGVATGGVLLASGNVAAILLRLALGWVADRIAHLVWVVLAGVLMLAALGFLITATATGAAFVVVGALLGTGMTSGWQGLYNYGVVKDNPTLAAAATGITQTGVFSGGVLGPALFGFVASRGSYPTAWSLVAALSVASAVLVYLVTRSNGQNTR